MRKPYTYIVLSLGLGLAATSAMAIAQAPAPSASPAPMQRGLLAHDSNGDGRLQRSEVQADARLLARFDRLDRDGDGVLAGAELQGPRLRAGQGRHPGQRGPAGMRGGAGAHAAFGMQADSNKDGRISAAEWQAGFAAHDFNKDGFIDQADHQLRAQQWRERWFAAADTDKDGKLSPAELEAARKMDGAQRGERTERAGRPPAR